jgi:hypothetical protein
MTTGPHQESPPRCRLTGRRNEDGTYTAAIEIDRGGQFAPDEELTVTNGSTINVFRLVIRCIEKYDLSLQLPDWFPIADRRSDDGQSPLEHPPESRTDLSLPGAG